MVRALAGGFGVFFSSSAVPIKCGVSNPIVHRTQLTNLPMGSFIPSPSLRLTFISLLRCWRHARVPSPNTVKPLVDNPFKTRLVINVP